MEIQIKQISNSEFNELNCHTLFEDKLTDRVFGVITNGIYICKFGWQSDTLKPFLLNLSDGICLIGIDQNLIIFDFIKKKEVLKSSLDYFFYKAVINKEHIYAITELEILKIRLISYEIVERYGLPDYFEKIEFKESSTEIHCVGDKKITVMFQSS